jgi:catechol 2,3-dioxygenase-like lactoylglutathione lyase family enzyme
MLTGYHHLSLTVTDLPASLAWYTDLFGLVPAMDEKHEGGRAIVLMRPETQLFVGLHEHDANDGRPFDETRTGLDHVSLGVPDRAALVRWQAILAERGITHSPISDQPWGCVLVFRDPDNIQLELCSPPAA